MLRNIENSMFVKITSFRCAIYLQKQIGFVVLKTPLTIGALALYIFRSENFGFARANAVLQQLAVHQQLVDFYNLLHRLTKFMFVRPSYNISCVGSQILQLKQLLNSWSINICPTIGRLFLNWFSKG